MSAGFDSDNSAKVFINDNHVMVETNESDNFRGLHIIVISPTDGHVISAKVFDTHVSSKRFDEFVNYEIDHFPDGCIIAAACKDECVFNLSNTGKKFFERMGSKHIWKVRYR